MKNVLKLVLPVSVFMLAIVGALAGNSLGNAKVAFIDVDGHLPTASGCVNKNVKCSTIPNPQMCTWQGQQLYRFEDGDCPDILYKKVN